MEIPQERQIHNHAMNYENYLSRAFKYDLNINRAHKQEFINLVNAELGKKMSFLPNYDTQLENVISHSLKFLQSFGCLYFALKFLIKKLCKIAKNCKFRV